MKGEVKYRGSMYVVEQTDPEAHMCPGSVMELSMRDSGIQTRDLGNGLSAVENPLDFIKALMHATEESDGVPNVLDEMFGQGRWHKVECKRDPETGMCKAVVGVHVQISPLPHDNAKSFKIGEMVVLPDEDIRQFDFVDEPIAIHIN